jgi:hypothetical protein
MSQTDRNISIDDDEQIADTEDPDVYDESEPMMEPEPPMESETPIVETEPEAPPPLDPTLEPSGLANEFKTIHSVQSPDPEPEPEPEPTGEDDVFFNDAADERTKKVGYN